MRLRYLLSLLVLSSLMGSGQLTPLHTLDCRGSEDYRVDDGRDYRGGVNVTKSGIPCMNWMDQSPHQHSLTFGDLPPAVYGIGSHNACRNPFYSDGAGTISSSPGCYTTDPKVRYETCNVGPTCQAKPLPGALSILMVSSRGTTDPLILGYPANELIKGEQPIALDSVLLSWTLSNAAPLQYGVLYYTVDGSTPLLSADKEGSTKLAGPLRAGQTVSVAPIADGVMVISAFVAVYPGETLVAGPPQAISPLVKQTFRVQYPAPAAPTFYPPPSDVQYQKPVLVFLMYRNQTSLPDGLSCFYSVAADAPQTPQTPYVGPFWVKGTSFVSGNCQRSYDLQTSSVGLAKYQLSGVPQLSPLIILPPSGSAFYGGVKLLMHVPNSNSGESALMQDVQYQLTVRSGNQSFIITTSSPIFSLTKAGKYTLEAVAISPNAQDSPMVRYEVTIFPVTTPRCETVPITAVGDARVTCTCDTASDPSSFLAGPLPILKMYVDDKIVQPQAAGNSGFIRLVQIGVFKVEATCSSDPSDATAPPGFRTTLHLSPTPLPGLNVLPEDLMRGLGLTVAPEEVSMHSFVPVFTAPLLLRVVKTTASSQDFIKYELLVDGIPVAPDDGPVLDDNLKGKLLPYNYIQPVSVNPQFGAVFVKWSLQRYPINYHPSNYSVNALIQPSILQTFTAKVYPPARNNAASSVYFRFLCQQPSIKNQALSYYASPFDIQSAVLQGLQLPASVTFLYPPPYPVFRLEGLHPLTVSYVQQRLALLTFTNSNQTCLSSSSQVLPLGCFLWGAMQSTSVLRDNTPFVAATFNVEDGLNVVDNCRAKCVSAVTSLGGIGILRSASTGPLTCACFASTVVVQNSLYWMTHAPLQAVCDPCQVSDGQNSAPTLMCGGLGKVSVYSSLGLDGGMTAITGAYLSMPIATSQDLPTTATRFNLILKGEGLQVAGEAESVVGTAKFIQAPSETCVSVAPVFSVVSSSGSLLIPSVLLPREGNYTLCLKLPRGLGDYWVRPKIFLARGGQVTAFPVTSAFSALTLDFAPTATLFSTKVDFQIKATASNACGSLTSVASLQFVVSLDGAAWTTVQTNVNTTVPGPGQGSLSLTAVHSSQNPCEILLVADTVSTRNAAGTSHVISVVLKDANSDMISPVATKLYKLVADTPAGQLLLIPNSYDYQVNSNDGTIQLSLDLPAVASNGANVSERLVNEAPRLFIIPFGGSCMDATVETALGYAPLRRPPLMSSTGDSLTLTTTGWLLLRTPDGEASAARAMSALTVCFQQSSGFPGLSVGLKKGRAAFSYAQIGLHQCLSRQVAGDTNMASGQQQQVVADERSCIINFGGVCSEMAPNRVLCLCMNLTTRSISLPSGINRCPDNSSHINDTAAEAGANTGPVDPLEVDANGNKYQYGSSAVLVVFLLLLGTSVIVLGRTCKQFGGKWSPDIEIDKQSSDSNSTAVEMPSKKETAEVLPPSVTKR